VLCIVFLRQCDRLLYLQNTLDRDPLRVRSPYPQTETLFFLRFLRIALQIINKGLAGKQACNLSGLTNMFGDALNANTNAVPESRQRNRPNLAHRKRSPQMSSISELPVLEVKEEG
jgi:hypothetical protein